MEKQIKIEVDVGELDRTLEKARELLALLKESQRIIHSLSLDLKD